MAKTNTGLVAYVKKQLGLPYWYGCFGQTGTQALYNSKKSQYPQYYDGSKYKQGWAHQYGKRVHDCVGLIKGYLWSASVTAAPKYNAAQDVSANGMLSACREKGKIATMPDIPGVLVFYNGHVGVYIGNGEVIEARGHDYGVVKTQLKARPWVNWGKCPYITYNAVTAPTVPTQTVKAKRYSVICYSVRVRKGAGITYPTVRYLRKGAIVTVTETKNNWGKIGTSQWITIKPAYVKEIK